eukprot:TRINITY_DN2127_c1_g1_i1.p1 TRINITY_DN2127_c1_g1~~TRINITY_DN2127_c1_g1_i1.p1  ORF type:complete len:132 (-),score=14.32 TRINITY_DN2127_c1_g1_i1:349-744(-)
MVAHSCGKVGACTTSCFISDLRENLRTNVKSWRPTSLFNVVELARLYKTMNLAQYRVAPPNVRRVTPSPATLLACPNLPKSSSLMKSRKGKTKACVSTMTKSLDWVTDASGSSILKGVCPRKMKKILPWMM